MTAVLCTSQKRSSFIPLPIFSSDANFPPMCGLAGTSASPRSRPSFGPSLQLPPGIQFGPGAGGTLTVTTVTRPEQGRYRMALNLFVNNLTNRTNFMGYSGVLTSPFYGKPTMAQGARRIFASMNLQF